MIDAAKRVSFEYGGHRLRFDTHRDLFSSFQVDIGTRLLLRTLSDGSGEIDGAPASVLDLGCGYGPLGIALASAGAGAVQLVDRDALALDFAHANAELNGLDEAAGLTVRGSLGCDDAEGEFDLVISNIPGRAGEPVLRSLLLGAERRLRPGGRVAIVVIEPVREAVAAMLEDEPRIEVTYRHETAEYGVFHYRFEGEPRDASADGFAAGDYDRAELTVDLGGPREATLRTVHGLAGFEGPGMRDRQLIRALRDVDPGGASNAGGAGGNIAVLNPVHGYVAVAAWQRLQPRRITLYDRDLLALRASRRNLELNGCPAEAIRTVHASSLPEAAQGERYELVIGALREPEGPEAASATVARAAALLSAGGRAVLCASSTVITRVLRHTEGAGRERVAGVRIARVRRRGLSIVTLTPR